MSQHNRTTTEIARRFVGKDNDAAVARIARRLENWGNVRLLTPVGERYTGRGRARAYDEHEQIKASVLLLTFAYQTPKAVLDLVSRLFDDLRSRSKKSNKRITAMAKLLEEAKAGKKDVYLILEPGEPEELPSATLGPSLNVLKDQDSAVVVNVTRAIRRVI